MRQRRQPEIIAGRVAADGSIIVATSEFSINKVATGNWSIIFPSSFRLISLVHTVSADALAYVVSDTYSDHSARVKLYNSAGAAMDQPWNFVAVGVQQ